jgi:hypothetical protein
MHKARVLRSSIATLLQGAYVILTWSDNHWEYDCSMEQVFTKKYIDVKAYYWYASSGYKLLSSIFLTSMRCCKKRNTAIQPDPTSSLSVLHNFLQYIISLLAMFRTMY